MIKLEFAKLDRKPIWILDKPVHIGSDKHNQLSIKDPSLSPRHATISLENGSYILKDLGSETGTFVMGQRISQRSIKSGDRIRLGNVELDVIDVFENPANLQTWTLIACSSQIGGQEYPLEPKTGHRSIKVGRAEHCDLIIPETHLSREHALLELESGGVRITDLSSAAGTYINDQRVTNDIARSGDRIRFDIYNFVLIGPERADNVAEPEPVNNDEQAAAQPQPQPTAAPPAEGVDADGDVKLDMDNTAEGDGDTQTDAITEAAPKRAILPLLIAGSLLSAAIAAAVFLLQ